METIRAWISSTVSLKRTGTDAEAGKQLFQTLQTGSKGTLSVPGHSGRSRHWVDTGWALGGHRADKRPMEL